MSLWLIAGLGNPGARYVFTRHNIGFMVVDAFAESRGFRIQEKRPGMAYAVYSEGAHRLCLCKPMTYMNRSGEAIASGLAWLGPDARLLVIHDDLDLEPGRLRIRKTGGHGGHRGIESIMEHLGHGGFLRLKVGIGRPPGTPVTDFVLEPFAEDERERIADAITRAVTAIEVLLNDGPDVAMNRFNPPPVLPEPDP